ncbi:MAG: prepilin-type N-terminal cleavage/methylation domain-containing protein [Campylobacterota bacterium]|nr:prepilin-type N-terminal cleavage/methylation domain-containing protein [Campylobacterota bacterium]
MRRAFTLIEMMISVVILSIIMLFLYESYSALNRSNSFYEKRVQEIKSEQLRKKAIFLDFSLAHSETVKILNQERDEDVLYMQSSNSLHKRYNPYIAYILKDKKLFRLESIKEFKEYPFSIDNNFEADFIGYVDRFRVYKSIKKREDATLVSYLVDIDFKEEDDILLKVKALNEQ